MPEMTRFAVNIADLTYFGPPGIVGLLLGPLIGDPKVTVTVEKNRVDGDALVLDRVDDPVRALCAIAVLMKKGKKVMPYPLRAYVEGPRGGWAKLPDLSDKTVEDLKTHVWLRGVI